MIAGRDIRNLPGSKPFSDEIVVLYPGSIVEKASAGELFDNPMHPDTRALLSAIPVPDLSHKRKRISRKGEITSPINLPDECRLCKPALRVRSVLQRGGFLL